MKSERPRLILGMPRANFLCVVLLIIGAVAGGITVGTLWNDRDQARAEAGAVVGQSQELVECVKGPQVDCQDEADQLEQTVDDVKDAEPGPAGTPGVDGEPGPAPTDAQVGLAVRSYCADGRCDGADGKSVTRQQVAAAVAAYCTSNGQCRGPAGQPGDTGQAGAPGAQGPPPTAQQVATAVEAYCATGACTGPRGATGDPGPAGPAGTDGQDGTAQPGTYTCPDGQVMHGLTVGDAGGVTLDCRDLPGLITP